MEGPESGRAHRHSASPPARIDRLERALGLDRPTYRTKKQAAFFTIFWVVLIAIQILANVIEGEYQRTFPALLLLYLGLAVISFEERIHAGRSEPWKVLRILGFLMLLLSSLAVAASTGDAIAGTSGAAVAVLGILVLCASIFFLERKRSHRDPR